MIKQVKFRKLCSDSSTFPVIPHSLSHFTQALSQTILKPGSHTIVEEGEKSRITICRQISLLTAFL